MSHKLLLCSAVFLILSCKPHSNSDNKVKLITLDPGHFHAALVQKSMYADVDPNVFVYAPGGTDLQEHLARINNYNSQSESPTLWNEQVYEGSDFFEKMIREKKGNVVVLAGNNQKKTDYINRSIQAGLNVLADKPMAINRTGFELLLKAFDAAGEKGLLLYDIMTERSEITTLLQREFSMDTLIFGHLEKGTPDDPAVTKESVHHFFKYVSGAPLKRPAWFFDVEQQGDGMVDVTTHLVDLIQWECFPEQVIDYRHDIIIDSSRRWPTVLTPLQFREVTSEVAYPEYLNKYVKDSLLNVFSNGVINYRINGVHARISVAWNYMAPEGTGDTHFSIMKGTFCDLIIRQGKEQNYKPVLYIEAKVPYTKIYDALYAKLHLLQNTYPGLHFNLNDKGWEVVIPDKYRIGHEEHFAQVMERFLEYLKQGNIPEWEIPNMKAKYYTTTRALEMATSSAK